MIPSAGALRGVGVSQERWGSVCHLSCFHRQPMHQPGREPSFCTLQTNASKMTLVFGYNPIMKSVKKQVFQRLSVGCNAPLYASLVIIFLKLDEWFSCEVWNAFCGIEHSKKPPVTHVVQTFPETWLSHDKDALKSWSWFSTLVSTGLYMLTEGLFSTFSFVVQIVPQQS